MVARAELKQDRAKERSKLIENAAAEQVTSYGEKQWRQDFVKLADLNEVDGMTLKGVKLQKAIWRALPDSPFKRFQRLFCNSTNYIVPKFRVVEGQIVFDQLALVPGSSDRYSVRGCIVDPSKLPDKLLEELTILSSSELEGAPMQRLTSKAKLEVVQKIKLIWDATLKIDPYSNRFLLIQAPTKELLEVYSSIRLSNQTDIEGLIWHSKRPRRAKRPSAKDSATWQEDPLMAQLFSSAHAAARQASHVRAGYTNEAAKLGALCARLKNLVAELGRDWKRGTPAERKAELTEKIKRVCKEGAWALRNSRDAYKQFANSLLECAKEARDALNRPNPTIVMAKISTAVENLQSRLREVRFKEGRVQYDRLGFVEKVAYSDQVMEEYSARIISMSVVVGPRTAPFSKGGSRNAKEVAARGLLKRLALDPASLSELEFYPYNRLAANITKMYQKFVKAVGDGNLHDSQDALLRMHLIMKIYWVYRGFEEMKRVVNQKVIDWKDLASSAELLKENFGKPQVYPERKISEVHQGYRHLYDKLKTIGGRLMYYASRPPNTENAIIVRERFKLFLKDFGLRDLIALF